MKGWWCGRRSFDSGCDRYILAGWSRQPSASTPTLGCVKTQICARIHFTGGVGLWLDSVAGHPTRVQINRMADRDAWESCYGRARYLGFKAHLWMAALQNLLNHGIIFLFLHSGTRLAGPRLFYIQWQWKCDTISDLFFLILGRNASSVYWRLLVRRKFREWSGSFEFWTRWYPTIAEHTDKVSY
jgi:hypothetical protein